MNTTLKAIATASTLIVSMASMAHGDKAAEHIAAGITADISAGLVSTGWTANDGDRGYKVIQVDVTDTGKSMQGVLGSDGKVISYTQNPAEFKTLNYDYDYKMWSDYEGWSIMADPAKGGPIYHMTFGELSFKGPKLEASNNMDVFSKFLVIIGKHIN